MCLDEIEGDFLNGRAVLEGLALGLERVPELLLVDDLARNAVHEDVHELIEVALVHRLEQELCNLSDTLLGRVWDTLLEVRGCL